MVDTKQAVYLSLLFAVGGVVCCVSVVVGAVVCDVLIVGRCWLLCVVGVLLREE